MFSLKIFFFFLIVISNFTLFIITSNNIIGILISWNWVGLESIGGMQWCSYFSISCSLRTFVFVHRVILELISWLLSNNTVLPLIKFSPFHDCLWKYIRCLVFLTTLVHFLASLCISNFSSIILWYWSDVIWTSHI